MSNEKMGRIFQVLLVKNLIPEAQVLNTELVSIEYDEIECWVKKL